MQTENSKKNEKSLKIILGDICYPKSEALIIPANSQGIMDRGILKRIVKDGWKGIEEEAKKNAIQEKVKIGDIFTTEPGRLKRRGVKKIYHVVIKRLPSDYTSVNIVTNGIKKALYQAIKDQWKSVTICGIGIEPGDLDKKTIAAITCEMCNRLKEQINIKIMDDNVDFINEVCDCHGEKYERSKRASANT